MNLSAAQQEPTKLTPLQLAAQAQNIRRRAELSAQAKRQRVFDPFRIHNNMGIAQRNSCDGILTAILIKLNKPKTNVEIAKKAKLHPDTNYGTLQRMVRNQQVIKLKFSKKSATRFLYILANQPYDTQKFVEVGT